MKQLWNKMIAYHDTLILIAQSKNANMYSVINLWGSGPLLCMAGYSSHFGTRNQLNNGPPQCICIPQFESRECTCWEFDVVCHKIEILCWQQHIRVLLTCSVCIVLVLVHSLLLNCGMHCGGPLFNWFLVLKRDKYPAMQSNGPLPHKSSCWNTYSICCWTFLYK